MAKVATIRTLIAIVTIAALLSTAYRPPAVELNRLVVIGIPLDRVTDRHSTPAYPQDARSLRIQGDVRVRIQVEKESVTAESASPTLAAYSSRWIRWHWQFKPSATGVYFLPISYKLAS